MYRQENSIRFSEIRFLPQNGGKVETPPGGRRRHQPVPPTQPSYPRGQARRKIMRPQSSPYHYHPYASRNFSHPVLLEREESRQAGRFRKHFVKYRVLLLIAITLLSLLVINRRTDRKSTRLNSSHVAISYAVFCLKKKKKY